MDHILNFNWRTYLSLYPDIPTPARFKGLYAFRHWLSHGRREGRYFPRRLEPELFPEEKQVDRERVMRRLRQSAVPVVICVDVEPDDHLFQPGQPPGWAGVEAALGLFQENRGELREKTGKDVRYSWFWRLDPQIGTALERPECLLELFKEDIRRLQDAGDEMALHVHCFRYDGKRKAWLLDYADGNWIKKCVETAVEAFRGYFGHPPVSHRFGDRWLDGCALDLLRRLGIRHDLTLEPGLELPQAAGNTLGAFPDLGRVPTGPFTWNGRSLYDPPGRAVHPGFWLVPLTTGRAKSAGNTVFPLNLALEPRLFRQIVNAALQDGDLPLLVSVLSTKCMTNPFVADVVRKNLLFLGGHFAARRMYFVTPGEALDLLLPGIGKDRNAP